MPRRTPHPRRRTDKLALTPFTFLLLVGRLLAGKADPDHVRRVYEASRPTWPARLQNGWPASYTGVHEPVDRAKLIADARAYHATHSDSN